MNDVSENGKLGEDPMYELHETGNVFSGGDVNDDSDLLDSSEDADKGDGDTTMDDSVRNT